MHQDEATPKPRERKLRKGAKQEPVKLSEADLNFFLEFLDGPPLLFEGTRAPSGNARLCAYIGNVPFLRFIVDEKEGPLCYLGTADPKVKRYK